MYFTPLDSAKGDSRVKLANDLQNIGNWIKLLSRLSVNLNFREKNQFIYLKKHLDYKKYVENEQNL